jgi:putative redox protein
MQTARIKWTGKEQFLAVTPSGHAVPLDSDRAANTAPGAMEMLLAALGACTATDVVIILGKKRQPLESLEVEVSGERAAEPPKVWTNLEIVFKLRGALDEKAVRDAIALSEDKYCSVSAMLKKTATVRTRFEIIRPQG